MFEKSIDWANAILTPILAFIIALDCYSGTPHWYVWYFAFLGLVYSFTTSVRCISNH